ncbi:MBL fold metallo-hydrolase [Steroidobacter sp.]|uniref:MBL fold metallo-hydrolase n=1 Tax=Steroidobacter sp. TaxID=1978227 RepID=UPI001A5F43D3|nr:MBL fold metallo-hydrolase [Steroidobacter sp.]MBL8264952.1 MBL fold metallo-hydrolase [Steroidobacter sp.]
MLSRIFQGAVLLAFVTLDSGAAVPEQVASNLYRLGTDADTAFVVTTAEGNILINSGSSEASNAALKPSTIRAQMAVLGLRFEDIKLLLASHAHADHVGGHALIRRLTGATVSIMDGDQRALRTGLANDYGISVKITEPCPVDEVLQDRAQVRLGGVTLTAYRTAGHTAGATTWALRVDREGRAQDLLLLDSTMQYRGRDFFAEEYPNRLRDYADGLRVLRELPADLAFDPHGGELRSRADIMQWLEAKSAQLRQEAAEQLRIQLDPVAWRVARQRASDDYQRMLTAPEARLAYPELQLSPELHR